MEVGHFVVSASAPAPRPVAPSGQPGVSPGQMSGQMHGPGIPLPPAPDAPGARRALRAVRSAMLFAGEMLASPALLMADLFHRDRTLTRRTIIAYLVLLAAVSSVAGVQLFAYRQDVEAAWTVLLSYEQSAQDLPGLPYAGEIRLYAGEQGLDPALVAAVIIAESSFRPEAVSPAGARGLMQIRPATWRELRPTSTCDGNHSPPACGADCIFDPAANIRAGVSYLGILLDEFGGNFVAAFAAYNAGASAVKAVDPLEVAIPPFPETENYVRQVLLRWAELRARNPDTSPVRRLAYAGNVNFVAAGVSLALWGLFAVWALAKGRRTGHLDALV